MLALFVKFSHSHKITQALINDVSQLTLILIKIFKSNETFERLVAEKCDDTVSKNSQNKRFIKSEAIFSKYFFHSSRLCRFVSLEGMATNWWHFKRVDCLTASYIDYNKNIILLLFKQKEDLSVVSSNRHGKYYKYLLTLTPWVFCTRKYPESTKIHQFCHTQNAGVLNPSESTSVDIGHILNPPKSTTNFLVDFGRFRIPCSHENLYSMLLHRIHQNLTYTVHATIIHQPTWPSS